MKKLIFSFIFATLLATSCGNSNNTGNNQTQEPTPEPQVHQLGVVNMDIIPADIDLKLSDLMSDIRIVTIAGDNNKVVSGDFSAITENRIIINNKNEILQYDYNGNYISTLAIKGRGPKEFVNAGNIYVTDSTSKVYIPESMGKPIMSVDLTTGDENEKTLFLMLDMNQPGKTVTVKKQYESRHKRGERYLAFKDSVFFFNHGYCDTIYSVVDSILTPHTVLQMKEIEDADGRTNALQLEYWYKEGVILNYMKYGTKEMSGPVIMTATTKKIKPTTLQNYYFIDHNNTLHNIKSFTIDPLGLTIDVKDFISAKNSNKKTICPQLLPNASYSHAYYKFEAYQFKELIKQSLTTGTPDTTQRKLLEELDNKLSENSNPVYIIGKIAI
jgi:6-bladed beta-propeller